MKLLSLPATTHRLHGPIDVQVEHQRDAIRVVARSKDVHSKVDIELLFSSGANDTALTISRQGERLEFAGATLDQHPAIGCVLRLIAEEVELRAPLRRIGFAHSNTAASNTAPLCSETEALLGFLFQCLFIYVERRHVAEPLPRWGRPIRDVRIERALLLLNRDLGKRWRVESLARAVGLSRPVFARRFVTVLGLSPMRYLTERRMQAAAALLFSSDATLAEVAAQVGYESEFAFSRAFKRYHQVPPGEYRQRMGVIPIFAQRMAA